MENFEYGVLKGLFVSNQDSNEDTEFTQKSDYKYDTTQEYTPPDVSLIPQAHFQKQQKQTNVETLVPLVVDRIISNIFDPNQKLKVFNTPVFAMCLLGKVKNLKKVPSVVHFDLDDSTGIIRVHYSNTSIVLEEDDYVQVIGSLVLITLANFYVDSQHIVNLGKYSRQVSERLKYHNVLVAYSAYNLDLGEKLRLQNKQVEISSDLPGPEIYRNLDQIELGPNYSHINDEVQISILKFLKTIPEEYCKKYTVFQALNKLHPESSIEKAIKTLVSQSEIVVTGDYVCIVKLEP